MKNKIEVARVELHHLAEINGFMDQRVLEQSMFLDELINKYNKIRYDLYKKKPIA
nr:aspartyl-phosphate phosphatase Spo0E family protein [Paenibacillus turicensis]